VLFWVPGVHEFCLDSNDGAAEVRPMMEAARAIDLIASMMKVDRETGLKKTNLNKIFAVFLYCIGRQLREDFYREFAFFLMMYRKALNEIGWIIKAEVTSLPVSDIEKRIEFCAINNGEYAPDICNDFITDKWSEYIPHYNLNGFKVLGGDTEMTKNAVFLTQHFCNWLNTQRYTNSRLQINEDNDI